MFTAYMFEAKAIQRLVLRGGKLKDMVAISNLLNAACDVPADGGRGRRSLVEDVAREAGLADADFARRAGGALIVAHSDRDRIVRFRALWQTAIQHHLIGIEFTDALGRGATAAEAIADAAAGEGRISSGQSRNVTHPLLPLANPLMQIAPRTGDAGCGLSAADGTAVDEATARARDADVDGDSARDQLAGRLAGDGAGDVHWPTNMERDDPSMSRRERPFPLLGENSYVGVVHADGNGLGQALLGLRTLVSGRPDATLIFRAFSDAIVRAMQGAAQDATREVLLTRTRSDRGLAVVPARPLVLAGDDVTIIVRGDLAIPFAERLVSRFRVRSRQELGRVWRGHAVSGRGLPEELSAGAGIAFVKASQPFSLAYGLAEQLTKVAKSTAKQVRARADVPAEGTVAFHRVSTSFVDDYDRILERELTIHETGRNGQTIARRLTSNPYSVEERSTLPRLASLGALKDLIAGDALARGPLRRLADLFAGDWAAAEAIHARWRVVVEERDPAALAAFEQAVAACLGADGANARRTSLAGLFSDGAGRASWTPLLDAMQWHMVEREAVR